MAKGAKVKTQQSRPRDERGLFISDNICTHDSVQRFLVGARMISTAYDEANVNYMENKNNKVQSTRIRIIETVQTPLGFFTLTVLVVEVILGLALHLRIIWIFG